MKRGRQGFCWEGGVREPEDVYWNGGRGGHKPFLWHVQFDRSLTKPGVESMVLEKGLAKLGCAGKHLDRS